VVSAQGETDVDPCHAAAPVTQVRVTSKSADQSSVGHLWWTTSWTALW
jgi:hypothetical protein